jgi:uncharacterized membrane protein
MTSVYRQIEPLADDLQAALNTLPNDPVRLRAIADDLRRVREGRRVHYVAPAEVLEEMCAHLYRAEEEIRAILENRFDPTTGVWALTFVQAALNLARRVEGHAMPPDSRFPTLSDGGPVWAR